MYAFAVLEELIPLYPVYALLFADTGLSTGRISTLLLLWSLTGLLLEVPSGALADRVSRSRLLAAGSLLRAIGFALWIAVPSYAGFAAGFVLWGTKGAVTSGTTQALTYDGLAAAGAADRYARVSGRTEVLSMLGLVAGTAAAVPLVAVGGYGLAGWVSVGVCVAQAAVALTLGWRRPHPPPAQPPGTGGGQAPGTGGGHSLGAGPAPEPHPAGVKAYLATLRAGLAEARSHRTVRRLLIVAALLPGFSALDEYLPLLARSTGASNTVVPVLLVVQYAGLALGAELAGRHPHVRSAHVAMITAGGAVLLAVGALSGHPVGFLGIGACYAALWFGTVVSDTRLQERMTGTARATTTSIAGVGSEAAALAVYGGYGIGALWAPTPVLVAALAVPLLLVAAAVPTWLPPARQRTPGAQRPAAPVPADSGPGDCGAGEEVEHR